MTVSHGVLPDVVEQVEELVLFKTSSGLSDHPKLFIKHCKHDHEDEKEEEESPDVFDTSGDECHKLTLFLINSQKPANFSCHLDNQN